MACHHGAAAIHGLVQDGSPALVEVAGKQVDICFFHMPAHFFRRHSAQHFHAILQAFLQNHAAKLHLHFPVADHAHTERVSFFLQGRRQLNSRFRVLPSDQPAGPQDGNPRVFLSDRCSRLLFLHQFGHIVSFDFREISPLVSSADIVMEDRRIRRRISACAQHIQRIALKTAVMEPCPCRRVRKISQSQPCLVKPFRVFEGEFFRFQSGKNVGIRSASDNDNIRIIDGFMRLLPLCFVTVGIYDIVRSVAVPPHRKSFFLYRLRCNENKITFQHFVHLIAKRFLMRRHIT